LSNPKIGSRVTPPVDLIVIVQYLFRLSSGVSHGIAYMPDSVKAEAGCSKKGVLDARDEGPIDAIRIEEEGQVQGNSQCVKCWEAFEGLQIDFFRYFKHEKRFNPHSGVRLMKLC
jgi:hypothetical protein